MMRYRERAGRRNPLSDSDYRSGLTKRFVDYVRIISIYRLDRRAGQATRDSVDFCNKWLCAFRFRKAEKRVRSEQQAADPKSSLENKRKTEISWLKLCSYTRVERSLILNLYRLNTRTEIELFFRVCGHFLHIRTEACNPLKSVLR